MVSITVLTCIVIIVIRKRLAFELGVLLETLIVNRNANVNKRNVIKNSVVEHVKSTIDV